MILNDQIMKYEDFDKYFIEIFMTYSLKDLTPYSNPDIPNPKHSLLLTDLKKDTMITDGYTTYVPIIEKLHMTHQKCVFHKIMNQRTPVWKTTNKIERQLKNKENQLEKTKEKNTTTRKTIQRTKTRKNTTQRQKKTKKQKETKKEKTKKKTKRKNTTKKKTKKKKKNK